MISPSAPYIRLPKPNLILKQSSQFVSAHALPLQSALAKARQAKAIAPPRARPKSIPSLVEIFKRYPSSETLSTNSSPFLASKYRAGHENPAIRPGQIRWRAPILKASARTTLCKQAFHWRLLKHIIKPSTSSVAHTGFYNGSLSAEEFEEIREDPVPRLINLLGGETRLTARDRRYLGLETASKSEVVRQVRRVDPAPLAFDSLPRYSKPTIVPGFGPYEGRRKAFKGKIRERERESKVAEVRTKMESMEVRIANYRKVRWIGS